MKTIGMGILRRFLLLYLPLNLGIKRIVNSIAVIIALFQILGLCTVTYYNFLHVIIYGQVSDISMKTKDAVGALFTITFLPQLIFWGAIFFFLWIREGFLTSKTA